jgi:disulfide bond formation protein DsbB
MQETLEPARAGEPAEAEAGSRADRLIYLLSAPSRHIALLAACIATAGSLFMSEVIGWQPCLLCWYQRILMYPLALILSVGLLRRDYGVHLYVLPLSLTGIVVSLYHYLLIKTDIFPAPPCAAGVPCTVDYIDWFGFINIPFLALIAFLVISFMMAASTLIAPPEDPDEAPRTSLGWSGITVFVIVAAVLIAFMLGSTFVA